MFDLNKDNLEKALVETSKLGKKKIKPDGLVTIINTMMEFMEFVKKNLPTAEENYHLKQGQVKVAEILEQIESFIPVYSMKVVPKSEFIRILSVESQVFIPVEHKDVVLKIANNNKNNNPNLKIVWVEEFIRPNQGYSSTKV